MSQLQAYLLQEPANLLLSTEAYLLLSSLADSVCLCTCVRFPGLGVTGGCEQPDTDDGNPIQVLKEQ